MWVLSTAGCVTLSCVLSAGTVPRVLGHLPSAAVLSPRNKCNHRTRSITSSLVCCAAGVVDVCLIPEVPFSLEKLKQCVAGVLEKKGHCVVCVAEGAGQVRTG